MGISNLFTIIIDLINIFYYYSIRIKEDLLVYIICLSDGNIIIVYIFFIQFIIFIKILKKI